MSGVWGVALGWAVRGMRWGGRGRQMEGGDGEVASLEAMLIQSKMQIAEDALTIIEVERESE